MQLYTQPLRFLGGSVPVRSSARELPRERFIKRAASKVRFQVTARHRRSATLHELLLIRVSTESLPLRKHRDSKREEHRGEESVRVPQMALRRAGAATAGALARSCFVRPTRALSEAPLAGGTRAAVACGTLWAQYRGVVSSAPPAPVTWAATGWAHEGQPSARGGDPTRGFSSQTQAASSTAEEYDPEKRTYRLEVTTGTLRGAGTSGRAELTLIGDQETSCPIPLEYEPGTSPGFERGTTLPFRVSTTTQLGRLERIQLRLMPELSSVGHGWFLERVRVVCEETGENWYFRSHTWFGESDCGGKDGALSKELTHRDPEVGRRKLDPGA